MSPPLKVTLILALVPLTSHAQHDPHRNATQQIARGDFAKAEELLAKAEKDDPETHFVRMMIALAQEDLKTATTHAESAIAAGLPFSRLQAGPHELLVNLYETDAFKRWNKKHANPGSLVVHGPMLGSVTDSSASFWVRTVTGARIVIRAGGRESAPVDTSALADFTAVAKLDDLSPTTAYDYQVLVNGKAAKVEKPRFKTFPARAKPAAFSIALGGGAGYVPKWEHMWDSIRSKDPLAMLMLGDNVYIDQPEHTLCQHYCYYRRQSRPEWRRLTASTAIYSIYDDHDFGTNDCKPGPDIESPPWKRSVWNIFRQNWVNPAYGGGEAQPGCWYDFHIADVHFILLDGRYYRDPKGGSMLGPVQLKWLKQTLRDSNATFKVLASPVPWTAGVKPGSKDTWDGFAQEREEIFSLIEEKKIPGVFLISADRHRTDLRTTERPDSYTLYEFESSRLTNRHTHKVIQTPGLIWGYNKECSFGLIRFDTTKPDPTATFDCISINGKTIHTHTLKRSALK